MPLFGSRWLHHNPLVGKHIPTRADRKHTHNETPQPSTPWLIEHSDCQSVKQSQLHISSLPSKACAVEAVSMLHWVPVLRNKHGTYAHSISLCSFHCASYHNMPLHMTWAWKPYGKFNPRFNKRPMHLLQRTNAPCVSTTNQSYIATSSHKAEPYLVASTVRQRTSTSAADISC